MILTKFSLSRAFLSQIDIVCSLKQESDVSLPCWVADGKAMDAQRERANDDKSLLVQLANCRT
jgi:hypothetical protein